MWMPTGSERDIDPKNFIWIDFISLTCSSLNIRNRFCHRLHGVGIFIRYIPRFKFWAVFSKSKPYSFMTFRWRISIVACIVMWLRLQIFPRRLVEVQDTVASSTVLPRGVSMACLCDSFQIGFMTNSWDLICVKYPLNKFIKLNFHKLAKWLYYGNGLVFTVTNSSNRQSRILKLWEYYGQIHWRYFLLSLIFNRW